MAGFNKFVLPRSTGGPTTGRIGFRDELVTSFFRHSLIVLAILIATTALYYNVTRSYFCSYDDFIEVHRAAFVDAPDPAGIFTTTHFNSFKYRPLNRALNLLSYEMDHGRAGAFRVRNLLFHLLNAALIYWLAILLRKSVAVAATATLLFAVHPLANQAVIGAVMTNTAAYSTYLLAILLFVLATRNRNREVLYVTLAGILGTASLFTYESNLVVFGAMAAYVFMLHFFLGQPVTKRLVITLSVVTVCSLGLYLGARQLFMASAYHAAAQSVVSPRLALWNTAAYLAALLQVFDPVLLNQWFGSPLPSDSNFFLGLHGLLFIVWTGVTVIAIGVVVFRLVRSSRPSERWVVDAFLVVAAWLPIVPMLLLAPHASETYLYLTVALMTVVMVSLLHDVYRAGLAPKWLLLVCGVCVTLGFGSATWVRNRRVAVCGATAHKILSTISLAGLRDGAVLGFEDAEGAQIAKPYGYYRFDGLNTVGKDSRDLQCAAQLVSGNDKIRAQMLDREELDRVETQHQPPSYDVLIVVGTGGNITQRKAAVP
jgi:hypothetical protein